MIGQSHRSVVGSSAIRRRRRRVVFGGAVIAFLGLFASARIVSQLGTAQARGDEDSPAGVTETDSAGEQLQGDWIVVTRGPDGLRVEVVSEDPMTGSAEGFVAAAGTEIVAVERDGPVELLADPHRPDQWALDMLPFEAVQASYDGSGVTVAVLDTSMALGHEDLEGVFVAGYDAITNSAYAPTSWQVADADHGTHVVGIIAARPENDLGTVGVAPGVQIMPVRVLHPGGGLVSDVVQGMLWAMDNGADVINLSLGTSNMSVSMQVAAEEAEARGVVVVAAAGNGGESGSPVRYPAAYPSVVSVAAVEASGEHWSQSTRAMTVHVAAPGVAVMSTGGLAVDDYLYLSGTSMATPHVSGVVAQMLQAHPGLAPGTVRSILASTADDVGTPGFDDETGFGLLDPDSAVAGALGALPKPLLALVDEGNILTWDSGQQFWVTGFELYENETLLGSHDVGPGSRSVGPASGVPTIFSGQSVGLDGAISERAYLSGPPVGFSAAGDVDSAQVIFGGTGDVAVTSYAVLRDGAVRAVLPAAGTMAHTFTDTSVLAGATHTYVVVPILVGGHGGEPSPTRTVSVQLQPPAVVPSFAVTPGVNRVSLDWDTPAGDVTSYQVFRDGEMIHEQAVGEDLFVTLVSEPLVDHSWAVRATGPGGAGELTPEVVAGGLAEVPNAPTDFRWSSANSTVNLFWQAPPGHVDRQILSRDGITIGVLAAASGFYPDRNAVPGATHVYRLVAEGPGGSSAAATLSVEVPTRPELLIWVLTDSGRALPFGDAVSFGATDSAVTLAPVVAGASTLGGDGYWVVHSDGTVDSHGDAIHHGDMSGLALNAPIVGMAVSRSGGGYWLVARDGGVFSFGDAVFYGSTGGLILNGPMASMTAGASGYWLVARDGGVFTFGVSFHGSLTELFSLSDERPEGVRIRAVDNGDGYYVLSAEGEIFSFGSASPAGSAASLLYPGETVVDLIVRER